MLENPQHQRCAWSQARVGAEPRASAPAPMAGSAALMAQPAFPDIGCHKTQRDSHRPHKENLVHICLLLIVGCPRRGAPGAQGARS
jgi:hypothetical protein